MALYISRNPYNIPTVSPPCLPRHCPTSRPCRRSSRRPPRPCRYGTRSATPFETPSTPLSAVRSRSATAYVPGVGSCSTEESAPCAAGSTPPGRPGSRPCTGGSASRCPCSPSTTPAAGPRTAGWPRTPCASCPRGLCTTRRAIPRGWPRPVGAQRARVPSRSLALELLGRVSTERVGLHLLVVADDGVLTRKGDLVSCPLVGSLIGVVQVDDIDAVDSSRDRAVVRRRDGDARDPSRRRRHHAVRHETPVGQPSAQEADDGREDGLRDARDGRGHLLRSPRHSSRRSEHDDVWVFLRRAVAPIHAGWTEIVYSAIL